MNGYVEPSSESFTNSTDTTEISSNSTSKNRF